MKIDNIDASRLGYGKIYLPFSVDIPDEQYWRYTETDQNYAILVEAVLKFKEICEKQKESIENKKRIINNFYGYDTRARAFNDFVTSWEDEYDYTKCCNRIDVKKVNKNNLETEKTNETTAFTSGEISW